MLVSSAKDDQTEKLLVILMHTSNWLYKKILWIFKKSDATCQTYIFKVHFVDHLGPCQSGKRDYSKIAWDFDESH